MKINNVFQSSPLFLILQKNPIILRETKKIGIKLLLQMSSMLQRTMYHFIEEKREY